MLSSQGESEKERERERERERKREREKERERERERERKREFGALYPLYYLCDVWRVCERGGRRGRASE